MESASRSSIRSSGRKLKRKTFDDFVSTSEWQSKTRKRLSIENPDVLPKFPKVEDEIQDTLQNPTISDNGNQSPSHKSVKKDDTNTETTTCGSQEKPKNDSVKDEAAANIRELPKRTKTLTSVKKNIQAARQKFDKKNKKESIVKDTVTSQSKSDVQGNARTLKEEREFAMKHSCKKSGCGRSSLTCCIKATKTCMEASGKSSRWYHMSLEEHYCNGCFDQFYRVKNSGCEDFHEWKRNWMQNSKADASFKNLTTYISEKQLPFWVRCVSCGHWRSLTNEVELTPNIVKTYKCIMGNLANTLGNHDDDNDNQRAPHIKYSCSADNDPCVETAVNPDVDWMHMLSYTPFLKNSPAAPFLTGYYPDGVGMSAVDTVNMRHLSEFSCEEENVLKPPSLEERIKQWSDLSNEQSSADESCEQGRQSSMMMSPGGRKHGGKDAKICVDGLNPYFQPFYKPHERGKALCMRPDVMELDEADEFPEFYKEQTVYLAVRNLVVALWTLQPRHALTVEDCCQHLITRSLTRARLCQLVVPRVLHFAVRKGLVNSGALGTMGNPRDHMLPAKYTSQKVLVVGAGPAGLAAARQLHNFGCDVTVVEARDRVGGRVHDDWTLDGVCVGRGAQIINGCVNNPLALISHQLDLKLHVLRPRCDLYDGSSEVTTRRRQKAVPVAMETDKRMDFHFNALLDIIVEWRQAQDDDAIDCSLGDKIAEAHQEWISQSGLSFSKLEERILDFHTGNLEFACGASLDKVSAFHWDQNEIFAQFSGDHAFVAYGFGSQLEAMAEGLDVRLNSPVSSISYNDSCAEVRTVNGECLKADRVVVSVPLAVLRSGSIEFKPPLPKEKTDSMNGLGCGCIEKIALLFPHRFWDKKTNGANYFGYIPANETNKGFCTVFYDIPQPQGGKSNVLMSVISGDSAERARNMSEERIKDVAISILATVFPEQEIPQPTKWFVTRWRDDKYAQMAYSYVRTGSSGDDYDVLAKQVGTRLFFAGEGTNRHFPQTVTGAYLSGLREAAKIAAANIS